MMHECTQIRYQYNGETDFTDKNEVLDSIRYEYIAHMKVSEIAWNKIIFMPSHQEPSVSLPHALF